MIIYNSVTYFVAMEVMNLLKSDRGRVYECTQCQFLGEKAACIKHFTNKHFGAEDHIYLCEMCNFCTSDSQKFKRHPTFYLAHNSTKINLISCGTYRGSDELYVKVNKSPRIIDVDAELKRWEAGPSAVYWQSKRKNAKLSLATNTNTLTCTSDLSLSASNTCLQLPEIVPRFTSEMSVAPVQTITTCSSTLPSNSNTTVKKLSLSVLTPVTVNQCTDNQSLTCESDIRFIQVTEDEFDFCDNIISMSDPVIEMPEPLRSPPCTVPRPSLPDIVLPPPEENILSQLLPDTSDTIDAPDSSQSSLETLVNLITEQNSLMKDMIKAINRNTDQCEKIEIAVRRLNRQPYTSNSQSCSFQTSHFRNRPSFQQNQSRWNSNKRNFVPSTSCSPPAKRVKSTVLRSSPKKYSYKKK